MMAPTETPAGTSAASESRRWLERLAEVGPSRDAYKFALLEAAVKVRRRAWQGREVPLEDAAWSTLAAATAWTGRGAEDAELFAVLREEIETGLSPRQREVLVAVALNDVPIDVLAERLGSTRGALYKSLHDARRKLRAALGERGIELEMQGEEVR